MKKCLIINDSIDGGGAERVMQNVVMHLLHNEYQVTVSADNCNKKEVLKVFPRKVKYFSWSFKWLAKVKRFSMPWLWQRIRYSLNRLCVWGYKQRQYDLVIAMKEGPSMQQALHYKAKRHVGWVHVDYRYLYWTKNSFSSAEAERLCMSAFDSIICVSEAARQSVKQTIGDPGNLCVCYNPIPVDQIREKARQCCTMVRKQDRMLFVATGRLASEKQHDMLLQVCAELAKKYQFELWLIGEGQKRKELERIINDNKLECVRLLGKQNNPYPLMQQADCVISTSKSESYGLVVQEALVLGIPVIATACPAMYETVDPRFGSVVPNDAQHILEEMEAVLLHPEQLMNRRINIEMHYSTNELWHSRLQKISDVLEGIMDEEEVKKNNCNHDVSSCS